MQKDKDPEIIRDANLLFRFWSK